MASVPQTPFDVRRDAAQAFKRWRPYLGPTAERLKRFAEQHKAEHGIEPTYREACEGLGIATAGQVSRIVTDLERRGIMRRDTSGNGPRMRLLNR